MKAIDRILQRIRIRQCIPHVDEGAYLLDIGCADGILFRMLEKKNVHGVGIDPELKTAVDFGRFQLIPGLFPDQFPESFGEFDVITALAVLEHISPDRYPEFITTCHRHLKREGKLILTVPSKRVESILRVLKLFRLIDGMALEEHHGFNPLQVPSLFSEEMGFTLVLHKRFELGLNHLYLVQKE